MAFIIVLLAKSRAAVPSSLGPIPRAALLPFSFARNVPAARNS